MVMGESATTSPGVVKLAWAVRNGTAVVTPENQDRFELQVRRALEACELRISAERFGLQLGILLRKLAQWLPGRAQVGGAFLTVREGNLLFLVVRDACEYDPDFEDELTALDLALAQDPDLDGIEVDVMAVPPVSDEALATFLDQRVRLAYRGEGA